MARIYQISKIKEIFIIFCIFQVSNTLPVSDTATSSVLRQKRDVNILQDKLIQTLHPEPILDTIKENERCCNLQQHPVGKKILSAIEQVTSVVANAIQAPVEKVNAASASITDYLNQIGAKLVGLQK
ncbi:uncharacterized protein [Halyomorpha halys]|uniref:uncharacterized protein n=1 Tax=Halyomorpha halys TaxID=286706 RepID=UPI0006D50291|nr:uncharacterized protein LOC106686855 [Halyomorpha halys]